MKTNRLAALLMGAAAVVSTGATAQLFGTALRVYPHPVASISTNPNIHAAGVNVYLTWSTFSTGTDCSDVFVKASNTTGASFGAATQVSACTAGQTNINPIVVGDGANVHVFWTDEEAGEGVGGANQNRGRIFYRKFTQSGGTLTPVAVVQTLVNQVGYSRPTGAIIDNTNNQKVHLVFYDNRTNSVGKVYHMLSCNAGTSWGAEYEVTQFDTGTDNEQPRIVQMTPSNEIVLTYRSSKGVPQGGWPPFQPMMLRMKTGGTCGGPVQADYFYPAMRLSRGSDVDLGNNYGPLLVAGANDALHAMWWSDRSGTNLQYRYGKPNGAGFGAQQDLSQFGLNHLQWTEVGERVGYGMGEDATGQLHAIFLQNSTTRAPLGFQAGSLWYRCAPSVAGAFVAKQILAGSTVATQPRAFYSNNKLHVIWADFQNTAVDQSEIYYNSVNTSIACTAPAAGSAPTPSVSTVDFGGNSMQTTSLGRSFTLTNNGGSTVSIGSMTPPANFAVQSTNCASLGTGQSCSITLTFTPPVTTPNATINGTLSIPYSGGANGTLNVNLTGVAEKSLVTHYYHGILGREPDQAGKDFWNGEAVRMTGLGANINETWFVMAGYFFASAEYLAANKNDAAFVNDLYVTFFNRAADSGGLNYWVGQIQQGMPREVVLFSFMFSPEFASFTQGIFGNTAARPEVDMVMDFFRGILNRLPDTSSFNFWLGQLRQAQCQGPGAVYTAVDNISAAFIFNAEYNNRNRNNTQYVTDMYYSFLRRGGDLQGVQFWINQLNTNQKDRNTVRTDFIATPEFAQRVNAVAGASCIP